MDAVVPIAGLATRLLPLTKAQAKAMLPVGSRVAIEHVVDELAGAGVRRVVIVASPRDRDAVAAHFAPARELEALLRGRGRGDLADAVAAVGAGVEVRVVEQPVARGLGDAVLCAREEIGERPFVLALGDALLTGPSDGRAPVIARLIGAFEAAQAACAIAVEEVDRDRLAGYGVIDPAGHGDVLDVRGIVEKPAAGDAPSRLAVAARYVCAPAVFGALAATAAGDAGELSLTTALARLLGEGHRIVAVPLQDGERRRDVGTLAGWREAMLEELLGDPSLRERARELLDG